MISYACAFLGFFISATNVACAGMPPEGPELSPEAKMLLKTSQDVSLETGSRVAAIRRLGDLKEDGTVDHLLKRFPADNEEYYSGNCGCARQIGRSESPAHFSRNSTQKPKWVRKTSCRVEDWDRSYHGGVLNRTLGSQPAYPGLKDGKPDVAYFSQFSTNKSIANYLDVSPIDNDPYYGAEWNDNTRSGQTSRDAK